MEPLNPEAIAKGVQSVLTKIRSAEEKSGRPAGTVRLVAATKTVTVEHIADGVRAGLSILGENRVQEALPKIAAFTQASVHWHFIGHLQRKKVRSVIGLFDLIHSVDSLDLAQELDRRAGEAGRQQNVLLEVNIGEGTDKGRVSSGRHCTVGTHDGTALSYLYQRLNDDPSADYCFGFCQIVFPPAP